jgi:4-amino-4-deoxy-L-arabinose transferase-like glycosyltransferase
VRRGGLALTEIQSKAKWMMVVLGVGVISLATEWPHSVQWTPDGLFYEAQSLEVRGQSTDQAQQSVFRGPIGQHVIAVDARVAPSVARQLGSPAWVRKSAQHYRRRWLVPALGAALSPLFGERSLEIASLLGFLVLAVFLYLLLVRRFSPPVSAIVSSIFLVLGPVRTYALYPLTDIWGVAMLLVSLYAAVLVLDRGPRWLWLWAAAMAVLSLTRETSVVALLGVLWLAIRAPRPRNLALLATGVAVTLPASLLLGGSLRANLAYNESGFQPQDSSWNYVVSHYWPALRSTVHSDLTVPHVEGWSTPHAILFYLLCAVLVVGVILLLRRGGDDPFFRLIRGTLPGAVLYIGLAVSYTSLRLEMAFLPALAVGLALLLETALVRSRAYSRESDLPKAAGERASAVGTLSGTGRPW